MAQDDGDLSNPCGGIHPDRATSKNFYLYGQNKLISSRFHDNDFYQSLPCFFVEFVFFVALSTARSLGQKLKK